MSENPEQEQTRSLELPLDVQDRIRAEEIFREQIRAQSLAPRSPWQKVNGVLGTPLGTFLLSIVIAQGAVWLYAKWSEHERQDADRAGRWQRTTHEVDFRAHEALKRTPKVEEMRNVLNGDVMPKYLFPEFSGWNLNTLLWELCILADREDTRKELRACIDGFATVEDLTKEARKLNDLRRAMSDLPRSSESVVGLIFSWRNCAIAVIVIVAFALGFWSKCVLSRRRSTHQ